VKASETLKKLDDEYPLLGFEAAGKTRKQVQQTTTIESTTK